MAEDNFLPASLEKLEIDSQRDTVCGSNFLYVNPFSRDGGGACRKTKKLKPIDETLGKLSFSGEECANTSCHCNIQHSVSPPAPCHDHPYDGWSGRKSILHVHPTVTFKRNLVRKSKLSVVCASMRKEDKKNKILKEPVLKLAKAIQNTLPLSKTDARMFPMSKLSADKKVMQGGGTVLSSDVAGSSKSQDLFGHSIISHQDFKSLLLLSPKEPSTDRNQTFSATGFHHMRANCRSEPNTCKGEPKPETRISSENTCIGCVVKKLATTGLTHSNGNSSGGQSCSQQARMTASSSCDDVTIDELASYFDVFVHIPKKMSHMAEMMYI
ncbi:hypothetical protein B7P43_G14354 [Cryptotermes secundus]|uniref:Oxidative stress-responsive serine-rich protein 1 n=2 Tax=Cryptotermes secundus TaxID=105785 RepID=A0A2J7R0R2_9NEOP|nr:uncharacterized protein LOC111864135 [Cryptotermes secundus]XP_023706946.1 uncharacterized protein LOC111864135 [Cryptotermes secundus]PNF34406.1 hypothetical protein B7P43_G14354 [Cryptotermes secundus]